MPLHTSWPALAAALALALPAAAQPHDAHAHAAPAPSPYAGEQTRRIKSLAGRGGHPGH